jgi:hypothetical protein
VDFDDLPLDQRNIITQLRWAAELVESGDITGIVLSTQTLTSVNECCVQTAVATGHHLLDRIVFMTRASRHILAKLEKDEVELCEALAEKTGGRWFLSED